MSLSEQFPKLVYMSKLGVRTVFKVLRSQLIWALFNLTSKLYVFRYATHGKINEFVGPVITEVVNILLIYLYLILPFY